MLIIGMEQGAYYTSAVLSTGSLVIYLLYVNYPWYSVTFCSFTVVYMGWNSLCFVIPKTTPL